MRLLIKKIPFMIACTGNHAVKRFRFSASLPATDMNRDRYVKGDPINTLIERIRYLVDQYGFVDMKEVLDITKYAKTHKTAISNEQCLSLLLILRRFATDCPADERTQNILRLWKDFQLIGVHHDIRHYNALLASHLNCGYKFSLIDFFKELKSRRLFANEMTYGLLIRRMCEDGDLSAARQTMEHMKSLSLSIGEKVFASLLHGHFVNREVDHVDSVLQEMEAGEVGRTAITYSELIQGYAKLDNPDAMFTFIKEAEELNLCQSFVLMDTICTLAECGHTQHIPAVRERLPEGTHVKEIAPCAIRLIVSGHDDLAYSLISVMPGALVSPGVMGCVGLFLLQTMVKHCRPVEKISEIGDLMYKRGFLRHYGISSAAYLAYRNRQTDFAIQCISQMQKEGYEIRSNYFYPALVQYAEEKKRSKFDDITQRSLACSSQKSSQMQDASRWIIPSLRNMGLTSNEIRLTLVTKYGFSDPFADAAFLLEMIVFKDTMTALDYVTQKTVVRSEDIWTLQRPIANHYSRTKDAESVIKVMKLAEKAHMSKDWSEFCNSKIVSGITTSGSVNEHDLLHLLRLMKDEKLYLTEDCVSNLTTGGDNLSHGLQEAFLSLSSPLQACVSAELKQVSSNRYRRTKSAAKMMLSDYMNYKRVISDDVADNESTESSTQYRQGESVTRKMLRDLSLKEVDVADKGQTKSMSETILGENLRKN